MLIISNNGPELNKSEKELSVIKEDAKVKDFASILSLYNALFCNQRNPADCLLNSSIDANQRDTSNDSQTPKKNSTSPLFDGIMDVSFMTAFNKYISAFTTQTGEHMCVEIENTIATYDTHINEPNMLDINYELYEQKDISSLDSLSHSLEFPIPTTSNMESVTNQLQNMDAAISEDVSNIPTQISPNESIDILPIMETDISMDIQDNEDLSKLVHPIPKFTDTMLGEALNDNALIDKSEIYPNANTLEKNTTFTDEDPLYMDPKYNESKVKIDSFVNAGKDKPISADIIFDRGGLNTMNISNLDSNQMQGSSLITQIVDRIDFSFKDGKSIIEMSLTPDFLGAIEIETIIKGKSIRMDITAEKSETNKLILSKIDELSALLSQKGFKVEQINVSDKTDYYSNNMSGAGYKQGFDNKETNQNNRYIPAITASTKTIKEDNPAIATSYNGSINIYI